MLSHHNNIKSCQEIQFKFDCSSILLNSLRQDLCRYVLAHNKGVIDGHAFVSNRNGLSYG
jgi:hypothetical protein